MSLSFYFCCFFLFRTFIHSSLNEATFIHISCMLSHDINRHHSIIDCTFSSSSSHSHFLQLSTPPNKMMSHRSLNQLSLTTLPSATTHAGTLITAPMPDKLYRVCSVGSAEAFLSELTSYIKSSPLYDLRICSSIEILRDRAIFKSLNSAVQNKTIQGTTVSVQSPSIKIHSMARPLHDGIAPMVCDFLGLVRQELPEHISKLRPQCLRKRLASATSARPWAKYSDTAITYGSAGDMLRPTIVFEVGASEPYENLVEDVRQWFLAGSGAQLVVLIDIQEDHEALQNRRKTDGFQNRFRQLVLKYAREDSVDKLGIQDDFGEMYRHLCDSEPENYLDFVGPIQVRLELWALENGVPQRRSSHQVIPPLDHTVELKASDLIPEQLLDTSNNRKVPFDLSLYRKFLGRGVKDLAFRRALDILHPRTAKEDDPEWTED